MNRYITTFLHTVTAILALLCLPSCSVEKQLDKANEKLMAQYQTLPALQSLPERPLSWQRAIAMLDNNTEIKQLQMQIDTARRDKERVYRDLIPSLDLGHYYNTALLKSNSAYGRNTSFNINIIFSIPALSQLPMDHYLRTLAHFKAEQNLLLKKRELVARLWQYFHEYELDMRKDAMEDANPSVRTADLTLIKREREIRERERSLKISMMLNDFSARWIPVADTTPNINWNSYRKMAVVPDKLTQTQMALRLESARLQKLGVALRYMPDVHVNFYSPSLFSVTGGETTGFMNGAKDVRMNLNTYMQIDTRLDIWSDWAQAKENYKLVEQELTRQMYQYRNKMELLLDSWHAYDDWLKSTQDYILFRRNQGVCDAGSVQELYREDLSLQKEMLDQAGANLERECALIQEYGLPDEHN